MSTVILFLIAALMLGSAAVAMLMKNLIHSALCLVVNWIAIGLFYLWAGAEFAAFAQVLVYAGAVSMIVLFAVLLTRRSHVELPSKRLNGAGRVFAGLVTGALAFGVMVWAVLTSNVEAFDNGAVELPMKDIGAQLATWHFSGVMIVGVILTVTLIGAVVIASPEKEEKQ